MDTITMRNNRLGRSVKAWGMPAVLAVWATLLLSPTSVASPPPSDWSIRNTGLENESACFSRAYRAMQQVNLENIRASGSSGYKGETESARAYVLCEDDGGIAYIFCAGDGANTLCDALAQSMVETEL